MLNNDGSKYVEEVPIQHGTIVIGAALKVITDAEWRRFSKRWERALLSAVISKSAKVVKTDNSVLDFDKVKGDIKATKKIAIPPFQTVQIQGLNRTHSNSKRVHVMDEAPEHMYSGQLKQ